MSPLHHVVRWAADNLSLLAVSTFTASMVSLGFSLIQVRRRLEERKRMMLREEASMLQEAARALETGETGETGNRPAGGAGGKQRWPDSPRNHGEILAPSGQGTPHAGGLPTESTLGRAL